MAVFKCKMCGGNIEFNTGDSVGICDSCGTKQTLPKATDDAVNSLFNRANTLRIKSEFDRAGELYNKIISVDETQAEAYWGLILCKYGIEYVEDPKTFKRVPTCHRASFESVTADEDFKLALKYGDSSQKKIYQSEAKAIDAIQKDILKIAADEKPFDVFLCYKETDENGRRTQDSVTANEIYHQLTMEGYKVFYAAITLEDKLGQEYEPYIFAALNSAKVMLVIGSKPEYFTAVWVKNEWSRFLKLMKTDRSKLLIPCYKDMDAYELPDDFAHLQAQDMSKIGFINDVVRGIKKVVNKEPEAPKVKETVVLNNAPVNANVAPLLERVFLFLEDGKWQDADIYCEKVLDIDPKNAEAYLGKLMAQLNVKSRKKLADCEEPFDNLDNYSKVIRFGDEKLENEIRGYIAQINEKNEEIRKEKIYNYALTDMGYNTVEDYEKASEEFKSISGYKDADALAEKCLEKAEVARKDKTYNIALNYLSYDIIEYCEKALNEFESISGWKDADEKISECYRKIEELKLKAENEKLEAERKAEERRIKAEKTKTMIKKLIKISFPVIAILVVFIIVLNSVIIPNNKYIKATKLIEESKYIEAISAFESLGGYKDSKSNIEKCLEQIRISLPVGTISAGYRSTVGIKSDDTVIATGLNTNGQCDVEKWNEIIAVAVGWHHTVGLKSDGTVVAVGNNGNYECEVSDWKNIVAVAAGITHTVGLRNDGTVIAIGLNGNSQCNVNEMKDIISVSAGGYNSVGLKSDCSAVAVGQNYYRQCHLLDWKNIVAISSGENHTVGLKSDGTVVATGYKDDGQCDVSSWKNIVAISAGSNNTIGLKYDGTVVAVGNNEYGQCDVTDWKDIVAISAGNDYTIGLKSDGTVVAVGNNDKGQCDVSDWKDIKTTK